MSSIVNTHLVLRSHCPMTVRFELEKPKMLLYKLDASPPSSSVMVLGDMLGLQFEYKDLDLINREHKQPEFKKINPMGTIPTLKDGDFVISESHTIMKYLLEVYGADQKETLYPSDVKTRAIIDQCMFFDTGVLFIRLKEISVATIWHGAKRPTEAQKQGIDDAYFVLEAYLQSTPYIAGDHPTLADICAGTTTTAMQVIHKVDEIKFPRTAAWLAKIKEHPSFRNVNAPGVELYKNVMNRSWEKNEES